MIILNENLLDSKKSELLKCNSKEELNKLFKEINQLHSFNKISSQEFRELVNIYNDKIKEII